MNNRKVLFTGILNSLISLLRNRISVVNKMFSDLYYDISLSESTMNYCTIDLLDSIKLTIEKSDQL